VVLDNENFEPATPFARWVITPTLLRYFPLLRCSLPLLCCYFWSRWFTSQSNNLYRFAWLVPFWKRFNSSLVRPIQSNLWLRKLFYAAFRAGSPVP